MERMRPILLKVKIRKDETLKDIVIDRKTQVVKPYKKNCFHF